MTSKLSRCVVNVKAICFLLMAFLWSFSFSACFETSLSEPGEGDNDTTEIMGDSGDVEESEPCAGVECPAFATCQAETGQCLCDDGYEALGDRCVAQSADGDWEEEDEIPEAEDEEAELQEEIEWEAEELEIEEESDSSEQVESDGLCAVPQAPTMTIIHQGEVLYFSTPWTGELQLGVSDDPTAQAPAEWQNRSSLTLDTLGQTTVFARIVGLSCHPQSFVFTYDVREHYSPAAGQEGSTAVAMGDPSIVGWATAVESIVYGEEVGDSWKNPDKALGAANGTSFDIVSLGRGGEIVLSFDPPIVNGEGYDFAVFENGFSDTFLELGFVEVSSDGETFLRFDGAYLGESEIGGFGSLDTTQVGSLAGKYKQGYGDPFDLEVFKNRSEMLSGSVDLQNIQYVKIVDIIGDGSETDSFGRTIYDPYPTVDSAGFDLDAVGVLNH